MALSIALHEPIKAQAFTFKSGSKRHGSIDFEDTDGARITIYTLPDVAQAVADAFNAAIDLGESE